MLLCSSGPFDNSVQRTRGYTGFVNDAVNFTQIYVFLLLFFLHLSRKLKSDHKILKSMAFLTKHNFNKDYFQEKKEILKCVHDAIL